MKALLVMLMKEIRLELRLQYAINSVFLFIASTTFVVYLALQQSRAILNAPTWNALLWVVVIFAAINAIAKSFVQESEARQLYYYQLVSPGIIIGSKMLYNFLLMMLMGWFSLGLYVIIFGNPLENFPIFLTNTLLGFLGLSAVMTLVSSIAAKTANSFTMMAVLGLPLIIPLMLLIVRLSTIAIQDMGWEVAGFYLFLLGLLDVGVIILAFILFPFIWRS